MGLLILLPRLKKTPHQEPAAEFQPTSFIDKYSHLLDENDLGYEATALDTPPSPENHSSDTVKLSDSFTSEGDDGDLEAYMSSLMRRVRGEISSESNGQSETKRHESNGKHETQTSKSSQKTAAGRNREAEVVSSQAPLGLLDMEELKATSNKSAMPIDLSAMRELANTSARTAIATHRKRRHFEGALGKFLVTTAAGGTAAGMILSAENYAHPLFLGGCAVGVVSAYWGLKLLGTFLEMIRDGDSRTDAVPAELSDEADPLPIDK